MLLAYPELSVQLALVTDASMVPWCRNTTTCHQRLTASRIHLQEAQLNEAEIQCL
jgi:hypothetical protein